MESHYIEQENKMIFQIRTRDKGDGELFKEKSKRYQSKQILNIEI
jgi:hypothetical protein